MSADKPAPPCNVCGQTPDSPNAYRRFELVVSLGADTWPDLLARLREMVDDMERDGPAYNLTTGSPSVGGWAKATERPEQTHEKYFADIEANLAREKVAASPEPQTRYTADSEDDGA